MFYFYWNLPLHPNYLFLSLLKTTLYTQTIFFCLYWKPPFTPNNTVLSLLKTSLYTQTVSAFTENHPLHLTILFYLYWKPPFTPKQSFSAFTEKKPLHLNNIVLSLLKISLHTQTIFFYLYWKPPFNPKLSFSIFTETRPLHPNYIFLSLLKTSLYTQTIFTENLPSHPNNLFSIFPENLPLYPNNVFLSFNLFCGRFVRHSFIGVSSGMERGGGQKHLLYTRGNGWGGEWMGRAFTSAVHQQCQNTSWRSNEQSWSTGQSMPHNIFVSSFPLALPICMGGHWVYAKYLCLSYPELQLITVAKEQQCKFPRQCNFLVVKLNRTGNTQCHQKKKKSHKKAAKKMRIGWAYSYLLYNCHREWKTSHVCNTNVSLSVNNTEHQHPHSVACWTGPTLVVICNWSQFSSLYCATNMGHFRFVCNFIVVVIAFI